MTPVGTRSEPDFWPWRCFLSPRGGIRWPCRPQFGSRRPSCARKEKPGAASRGSHATGEARTEPDRRAAGAGAFTRRREVAMRRPTSTVADDHLTPFKIEDGALQLVPPAPTVPLLVRWIRTRERLVVEGGATRGDSEELTVRAPRRPASPAGIATLGVPFSGRSEKKRDVAGLAQKEDLRVAGRRHRRTQGPGEAGTSWDRCRDRRSGLPQFARRPS